MPKFAALFFILMLLLAACGAQNTPSSTRVPQPSATPAASQTPPQPTATSALTILARSSATPFAFPQRAVPAPICDGAPPTQLISHERARVTNDDPKPLNVRESAGTRGRIVEQLETLDIFMVVDGPRCADSYTWYKIRTGDVEGWVAEGDAESYYIEPYMP